MDLSALIPITGIFSGVAIMWICYKVMELRVTGRKALEQAGRESAEKKQLEARLAVLERIVTDRGIQTAEQIEALRHKDAEELRTHMIDLSRHPTDEIGNLR